MTAVSAKDPWGERRSSPGKGDVSSCLLWDNAVCPLELAGGAHAVSVPVLHSLAHCNGECVLTNPDGWGLLGHLGI